MLFEAFILLVVLPLFFLTLVLIGAFVIIPCAFIFASWYMRIYERKKQRRLRDGPNLAFFHPYCNAGGGGERVLWVAIKAILTRYPDTNIYIYTVETAEPQAIVNKVQNTFNVKVDASKLNLISHDIGLSATAVSGGHTLERDTAMGLFIRTYGCRSLLSRLDQSWLGRYAGWPVEFQLVSKRAIEAKSYPYFTLLMQSLGSMVMGMEAFMKFNPDIFVDTTGYAFTYPIFRYLAQCPVGTYTHYPIITTSMMRRVQQRIVSYNNRGIIARNPVFTWCKLVYYKVFGWLYGIVGRCADVVMVNGTWTEDHINELWNSPCKTHRVYPPCEVTELKQLRSLVKDTDPIQILSVSQFRPEKDHPLMLQAMYELRNLLVKNEVLWNKIKLVFVGACRNAEDEERVQNLKDLAKHLSLENSVQFVVNAPYTRLLQLYQTSSIGLHAMWNEHFGISVVELMAAGLITIAHRSGGPLADIVETTETSRTGFLCSEADEYARAILEVIALAPEERQRIIDAARASVDRFTTVEFEKTFLRVAEPLMKLD